jgi:hypothetical protein
MLKVDSVLSKERRAKLQELADSMHVAIWQPSDGSAPQHVKRDTVVPAGAEVFRPQKPWQDSPHGSDPTPQEPPATA